MWTAFRWWDTGLRTAAPPSSSGRLVMLVLNRVGAQYPPQGMVVRRLGQRKLLEGS